MLAVPLGSPLERITLAAVILIVLAAAALWWRARRWVRAADQTELNEDTEYDDKVRDALKELSR